MPGDLAEKIKLWSVLNRILKNNGFIDTDQINADIATLKEKVHTLLNEIFGVEHTLDNVNEYNDTPIKETITNLDVRLQNEVDLLRTDINALFDKLSGITTTATQIALSKTTKNASQHY
jgi:hypothetical protein